MQWTKPKSGDTAVLQHGLASRGAAPPRLPALAVAAIIQPLQDTKRCCCPAACSYTFRFGFVRRRNVLNAVSIFFFSHRSLVQQVQHPRGRRLLPIDRGRGRACPSQRLRPVLTDRSDERGRGWEATAAGREREGAAAGASPGLVLPLDRQPSITRASSRHGGDAAAPPRRGVGLGTTLDGEYSLILNYIQYLER